MTYTQYCVLRVLHGQGGAMRWYDATAMVRLRSGRTVRPNASTLVTMQKAGLVAIYDGSDVWMTNAGRTALAVAASRRGIALADDSESLVGGAGR
jgi:hypothetical protein